MSKLSFPVFPTSLQESIGVLSVIFVMPWLLTLVTSLPCWDSVLAVWDLIILHGIYTHTQTHMHECTSPQTINIDIIVDL